ncbi:MAG: CerR family C-terminal domain-containing protein, partial [Planctomycetia bacterium]
CAAAGANLAAVNYHFGDKRRLYVEAVKHAHCVRFSQMPMAELPPDASAVDRLRHFIDVMVRRVCDPQRPQWHEGLMAREMAQPTEATAELVRELIKPDADRLKAILDDLLPAGTPKVDEWMTAFSIVGQVLFYKGHEPIMRLLSGPEVHPHLHVERLSDHIVRFSLAALGCGPPLPQTFGVGTPPAETADPSAEVRP